MVKPEEREFVFWFYLWHMQKKSNYKKSCGTERFQRIDIQGTYVEPKQSIP